MLALYLLLPTPKLDEFLWLYSEIFHNLSGCRKSMTGISYWMWSMFGMLPEDFHWAIESFCTLCTEWENSHTSVHCLKGLLRSASLNSESMLEFILVCSFFSSLHLQSLLQRDFTEVSLDLNQHHVVSEWLRSCFVFEPCFRVLDCNSKWQMTGISYFAKHPSFFHQQQQHHIYKLRLRYVVIKNVEMYLVSSNSAFPVWSKFKLQRR